LIVKWYGKAEESIRLKYNPTELSFDKSAQIAEIAIPGLDAPLLQYVRGQAERLSLDLFFDSTDDGMAAGRNGARSVTEQTDRIFQLIKIEPARHAPPICEFVWNDRFPGSSLSTVASSGTGNQNRNGFPCIVESLKQKFTLFSPDGVPLRATLTVGLREFRTLEQQIAQLNKHSPDRTQAHVVQRGDTLSAIAARHYGRPDEWRRIAGENKIEDPRRIAAGAVLIVPPIA
jgi:LysM repeat protein